MSKGSRSRSISQKFKDNFDKIKWPDEPIFENKPRKARRRVHHIMPDIQPYKAVAGDEAKRGEYITSRAKEREYLRRNNCVQVGNEWGTFEKHGGKTEDNPTKDW